MLSVYSDSVDNNYVTQFAGSSFFPIVMSKVYRLFQFHEQSFLSFLFPSLFPSIYFLSFSFIPSFSID
ncbi:hypothetical protein RCL_jg9773.t1 [Rhizophagus clarus]|uniref:Uncharacterized protein n=1 Tax=Rhizophagus clarus TaxID=94130 RepID=A0A8H3LV35_9GLOM|nr:hypothetical protein RCL_jg9773.t1 [Rhizophagus clarus]